MLVVVAMYVSAWLLPAISIGFDYNESVGGIKTGLIYGAILCALSMYILDLILPTVQ